MTARTATISRKTNETQIEVFVSLDCAPGSGQTQNIDVSTGIGFLDHVAVSPYSGCVDELIGFSRCIMHWQSIAECR